MNAITKDRLPPGPVSLNPFRHIIDLRKDTLAFLRKIAEQYGDIVHFRMGPLRVVLLNHPDYIKEVLTVQHKNFTKGRPLEMLKILMGEGLLTGEGELHKKHSAIIQPAFHRKMIDLYADIMIDCVEQMIESWEDGMKLDINKEMIRVSLAITGKTFFSADLEKDAPEIISALHEIMKLFGRITMPLAELLFYLPTPGTLKFKRAKAKLDKKINELIEARRSSGIDHGDVLSMLINAKDETSGKPALSDQEIRDEALTLLLTGFDTTSNALSWTWYLIAKNPDVQVALQKEADNVLQGRVPTLQNVPQLKYTRMVFGEAMRVCPPTYVIAREASDKFFISDYVIPAGTLMLMSPYLIHHDPRFHEQPDQYNPLQWEQHSKKPNAKYEYFPFGAGPRSCIGQGYAWMEAILLLSAVSGKWHMNLSPDHPVVAAQLLNLRPKNGIIMELKRR